MNKIGVVVFLALLASVFCIDDLRLLKFSDTEQHWHTMAEVVELRQKNINFMDITEFQDALTSVPVPPPLPNQPQQKSVVNQLNGYLSITNMRSNVEILSSYTTRYYNTDTGVEAAEWIRDTLLAYSSSRSDVTVSYFTATNTNPQPSVIARVQGAVSDDLVIIGCHEDSIHLGALGVAPGVDDDGSGVVSLLEIFRVLMSNNYVFNRTVEFHFYAAEEVGLRGSQAIAQNYAANNKVVVGMLQLDMTFYVGQNKENIVGIVTDYTNSDLNRFVRELVDAYSAIPWVNTQCGYGCSDHASWTYAGYRSAFPFESEFSQSNPYIHTAQDTLANVDWAHAINFAKIGLGFVVELGATEYFSSGF